jgi:hypothetical protein
MNQSMTGDYRLLAPTRVVLPVSGSLYRSRPSRAPRQSLQEVPITPWPVQADRRPVPPSVGTILSTCSGLESLFDT